MKGIILLNGEPYRGEIDDKNALVYCCDGAYRWAKGKTRIDKNLGDFDSLDETPYPPPDEVYPSEKDFTDGEIALKKIIDAGADEIVLYGGGGGREDHFLGNLHLIYKAVQSGKKCKMICNNSEIVGFKNGARLDGLKGKTVSVLPFGERLHIMGSEGLKYAYPEYIGYGECRGISNIVESDRAFLDFEGFALIIINGREV